MSATAPTILPRNCWTFLTNLASRTVSGGWSRTEQQIWRNVSLFNADVLFYEWFIIDFLVGRIINNQGKGKEIKGMEDDEDLEELNEEEIEELIRALEEHDEVS